MLKFLEGHKTNLIALCGVLLSFAYSMDWIDERLALALGAALGSGGMATIRHAMAQSEQKMASAVVTVSQQVASVAHDTAVVSSQVADVKDKVVEVATPNVIVRPGA
jgi:hypothetical protein